VNRVIPEAAADGMVADTGDRQRPQRSRVAGQSGNFQPTFMLAGNRLQHAGRAYGCLASAYRASARMRLPDSRVNRRASQKKRSIRPTPIS